MVLGLEPNFDDFHWGDDRDSFSHAGSEASWREFSLEQEDRFAGSKLPKNVACPDTAPVSLFARNCLYHS